MTNKMQYLRSAAIAVLVTGCTTFTASQVTLRNPITGEYTGGDARGILIPERVPLLVISNGQVSTIMICSPDRATSVEFGAFMAKHDVQMEFNENCGLKSLKSNQDSTAVPLKLIETIGSLAEHVIPAGKGLSGTEAESTSVQIYRIIFRDGEIVGLRPLLNSDNFPPLPLRYERMPVATDNVSVTTINNKAPPAQKQK